MRSGEYAWRRVGFLLLVSLTCACSVESTKNLVGGGKLEPAPDSDETAAERLPSQAGVVDAASPREDLFAVTDAGPALVPVDEEPPTSEMTGVDAASPYARLPRCAATPEGPLAYLIRFESTAPSEQIGREYRFTDETDGTQNISYVPGSYDGSTHLQLLGEGFTDWGAGFGYDFGASPCLLDLSDFKGIRFQARGSGRLRLQVGEPDLIPRSEGGECDTICYDAFVTTFDLTDCWRLYQIPFSELAQAGWGEDAGPLDLNRIAYLSFGYDELVSVDVQMDDIAFFESPVDPEVRCPLDAGSGVVQLED